MAHGVPEKRREIIRGDAEFVIINYDGVKIVADEIAKGGFDLIVVDEATHYKNARTTRWKTLRNIMTDDTWLWMMTGTPAAQSPLDAYGLAKLVNPTGVPRFFGSFRDMVMFRKTHFKWETKRERCKRSPQSSATCDTVYQRRVSRLTANGICQTCC